MEVSAPRCAGLDVHKKSVMVGVRLVEKGGLRKEVREFGTMTNQLLELADWLAAQGVTHVAMESTGVLWKPVYNLLEGRFTLLVCNAQHIKNVPGRKTDVKDCEWLAQLLQHGLLRASFIPPPPIRELRDLTRERTCRVEDRVRVVNRIEKVLENANLKLQSVASNIVGVSGQAMLQAIVAGERDAAKLAQLARGRLCSKRAQLEEALTGRITEHHVFMLRQGLEQLNNLETQIEAFSQRISGVQAREDQASGPPAQAASGPNSASASNLRSSGNTVTFAAAMAGLETIPGVGVKVAEGILAEIGLDMSQFGSGERLASWAGICPGNNESGGRQLSGKTRKGNRALRSLLCEAAWAAWRSKTTYLSAQFTRLMRRRGAKRAAVAVGHTILKIVFHILRDGVVYEELGSDYFVKLNPEKLTRQLVKRLEKLGHRVVLQPV